MRTFMILAVCVVAGLSGAFSQDTQGGTLRFGAPLGKKSDLAEPERQISLVNYAGKPLKGLQLRIIVTGPLQVAAVAPGAAIAKPGEWSLHSVIARRTHTPDTPYQDTVKVVLFGNGRAALAGGPNSHLLTLRFDTAEPMKSAGATMKLSLRDVLGALDNGDNAGVLPDADDAFDVALP